MKKIITVFLCAVLVLSAAFSTTAFAAEYSVNNLPFEIDSDFKKEPMQEKELSPEVMEEILQKLLETEYQNCSPDDIVIRYYGALSNGAMLINHYNKTYDYSDYEGLFRETIRYENISFVYYEKSDSNAVSLYINGGFYTFEEAYEAGLINIDILGEMVTVVDNFNFCISSWCDDVLGDVNGDGKLDITDVSSIQKYLVEKEVFTDVQLKLADADCDGRISVTDATCLQKRLAEFI